MNLEEDPKFISLKDLAGTNADAQRLATELSNAFGGTGAR